jgi:hypothetical protein
LREVVPFRARKFLKGVFMRIYVVVAAILAAGLLAGCKHSATAVHGNATATAQQAPANAAPTKPASTKPPVSSNPYYIAEDNRPSVKVGKCEITVLETYLWRDWQPVVNHPGPDRGSPLHSRVSFWLDNSTGDAAKFTYKAAIIDAKGQSQALDLRILPNFGVLPEDVAKSFGDLGEQDRMNAIAQYNVVWDGTLKKGESRQVTLLGADGPYLLAGSEARIEVTWTDAAGNAVVIKTDETGINRTD